jgi:trans-aconitate methyltransferase
MTTWDPAQYARCSDAQMRWAEKLLSRLALTGNEVVLDLGCGDGKITAALARGVPPAFPVFYFGALFEWGTSTEDP